MKIKNDKFNNPPKFIATVMIFLTKFYLIFSLVLISCEFKMEPFVVGSVYTTIGQYPHCIYLAVDCSRPWICGASILNQKMLITAAHCVNICDTTDSDHMIEAYAGHENLEKVISKREVGVIKFHEKYEERSAANDLALAGLKKSLYLGENIKRIVISPQFPNVNKGEVAGWGIVDQDRASTLTILKSVTQNIRNARVCARVGKLHKGMFCAGSTRLEGPHPADGDSGSALIANDFTQLGLVSFRSRRLPALMVYTNITYYYDWIHHNARKLFCQIFNSFPESDKL
ncbi:hypothetical protein PYW08_007504 [Mythimna loreyi]|uniref:Uncharacterized protein n=1 Tax=Mythimna loreyi TaxID=667449 RepID=A0ACC2QC22_9NEOP|nr:hypothetical protein PYW08_007504 [Mythimna loreyi]